MEDRIPTSVLSIIESKREDGEKLTTLTCRMTGEFKSFTQAIIFPGEKKFQVRDIIHDNGNIYKVKVKGIATKNCTPFSVITPVDLKVRYSKKAYFIPKNFHSKEFFPGDYYITGGIFNGYRMFKKDKYHGKVKSAGNLYTVDFPFKSPLVPGAEYYFENSRGFKGEMILIYPGEMSKKGESIVSSRIEKFRSRPGIKGIYSIILRTDNYVELPYFIEDEEFEGSVKFGNIRILDREYEAVKGKILKQSRSSGGVLFNSVKKSCKVTPAFFHTVVDQLIKEEEIFIDNEYIVSNSENRDEFLSPLTKECYSLIVKGGSNGVSHRSVKDRGMVNCFQEIQRMRLATVLDEDLYFSSNGYKELLAKIFNGLTVGDNLTIQDIRESSGLSRRYIISLLNILEDDNIIEREEDDERVIKAIP